MCIIGGCSKVTQDIPPFMMADGHPLKVRGINSTGLKRRGVEAPTRKTLKDAYRILYRKDLSTSQALEELRPMKGAEHIDDLVEFVEHSERGIAK
jgi:UDP-N-acetylglucosamine acyltransferase